MSWIPVSSQQCELNPSNMSFVPGSSHQYELTETPYLHFKLTSLRNILPQEDNNYTGGDSNHVYST
uniref:Uncharacterized protein n=1 Tax=Arion vulgaris TaxID=1028688 RepID=A0A0B7AII8_9EUPU